MSGDLSGFSLMELFRMEAETHSSTPSAGLVSLEESSATREVIDPLMRAAHSLRGAARIVGLDSIVRVAHAMEDCFAEAQKGRLALRPEHVDVLLKGVDMLAQVAHLDEAEAEAWQMEHAGEIDDLVTELKTTKNDRPPAIGVPPSSNVPPTEAFLSPVVLPGITGKPTFAGRAERDRREEKIVAPKVSMTEVHGSVIDKARAEAVGGTAGTTPGIEKGPDFVVRISAKSLTRLLGLASEALVQSHRLPSLVDSLWQLKRKQTGLLEVLQSLEDRFSSREHSVTAVDCERLAKAKMQASQGLHKLGETGEAIEEFARQSEALSGRLHHEILTSRMRPLCDGTRGSPRMVRDLARELGKQARLEVIGETTGVDRDILDRLEAPLNHRIRNALDHGLEMPKDRQAAGKPAVGIIRLEAHHAAGMLQIALSDDGRGIDIERLRTKVVERELTTKAIAKDLSENELLEFLFLPGFSTKEHVTEVSGRGVRLDVVHNMVRAVGGSVRVHARPKKSTRFVLQLPITVSVIRALLVEIVDEPYAFPLSRTDRIVMLDRNDLRDLEGKPHLMLDDQLVGLVEASVVLELSVGHAHKMGKRLPVVIASDRSHRFGVVVDRFLSERDVHVSPLDPRLGRAKK